MTTSARRRTSAPRIVIKSEAPGPAPTRKTRPRLTLCKSLFSKESARAAREHFFGEPFAGTFRGGWRKVRRDRLAHRVRQLARAVGTEQHCRQRQLIALDNGPDSDRGRA